MTTLLIDSNYIGHQARFSHKGLKDSKGRPTNVLYGFLSRILFLGLMFKTNHIAFCWDSKKSIRKLIFPGYKNRTQNLTEEEIEDRRKADIQFRLLEKEILPAIGFNNNLKQSGYEADDLLAEIICSWIGEFIIITGDVDLYQLLYGCRVYHPSPKNIMMTIGKLKKEYGISPAQWIRVKQIAGCTSDKVPGIEGVGIKKAIQYINKELDTEGKIYSKIVSKAGKEIIEFNKQLVSLPLRGCNVPGYQMNSFNIRNFAKICSEYDFDSFLEEINFENWKTFFSGSFADKMPERKMKDVSDVPISGRRGLSRKVVK